MCVEFQVTVFGISGAKNLSAKAYGLSPDHELGYCIALGLGQFSMIFRLRWSLMIYAIVCKK